MKPFHLCVATCTLKFPTYKDDAQEAVLMEDCIAKIRKWMALNKLKLSKEKTELLTVLPSHETHKWNISSINIGGCEVRKSECVKALVCSSVTQCTWKTQLTLL